MNVTAKYNHLPPAERMAVLSIHAEELRRMVGELIDAGEFHPLEGPLLDMADQHISNGLEVLKGIKLGRA